VRGAFTGAVRDKTGLFELATSGSLFLDEIGEMAPAIQAKLLRALQEGEIRKVGSERSTRVNPRVIAATNRDLRAQVAAGAFREDLYFRLGAFVITVPPLRDRREAIPTLVQHFLRAAARKMKKEVRGISSEAMTLLMGYRWPGNVRELEHAIQRAVILAHGPTVTVRELPPEVKSRSADAPGDETLDLGEQERSTIRRALERFSGNRKQAAKALNISTVTLWRRMKQFGLVEDPGRAPRE
jgi:two-component system response regulator HydG